MDWSFLQNLMGGQAGQAGQGAQQFGELPAAMSSTAGSGGVSGFFSNPSNLMALGKIMTSMGSALGGPGSFGERFDQGADQLLRARNVAGAYGRTAQPQQQPQAQLVQPSAMTQSSATSTNNISTNPLESFLGGMTSMSPREVALGMMSPQNFGRMVSSRGNVPVNPSNSSTPMASGVGQQMAAPMPQVEQPREAVQTQPQQQQSQISSAPSWIDFVGMAPQDLQAATAAGRESFMSPVERQLANAQIVNQLSQAMMHGASAQTLPGKLDIARQKMANELELGQGKLALQESHLGLQRDRIGMMQEANDYKNQAMLAKTEGDISKANAANLAAEAKMHMAKSYQDRIEFENEGRTDHNDIRAMEAIDKAQKNMLTGYRDDLSFLVNVASAKPGDKVSQTVVDQANNDLKRYRELSTDYADILKGIRSKRTGNASQPPSAGIPQKFSVGPKTHSKGNIFLTPDGKSVFFKGKEYSADEFVKQFGAQ